MRKIASFLSLFTSVGTLMCCALPALFVVLGFGAAFAGFVTAFPQIVWISEHKGLVFGLGGILLFAGGVLQFGARKMACPIDPVTGKACSEARDWSFPVYLVSCVMYGVGVFFAFILQHL